MACSSVFAANGTYQVDAHHTFARFEYNHWGLTNVGGRFDRTSGKIKIDTDKQLGSAEIVIDATSVSMGSDEFNEDIQSEDFFDTKKYPTIVFHSTRFNFESDKLISVDGNLTIKGMSKPVTLVLSSFLCKPHPLFKKDYCGANASAKIRRSDFGAGKFAPFVGDEVTLNIALEAAKE